MRTGTSVHNMMYNYNYIVCLPYIRRRNTLPVPSLLPHQYLCRLTCWCAKFSFGQRPTQIDSFLSLSLSLSHDFQHSCILPHIYILFFHLPPPLDRLCKHPLLLLIHPCSVAYLQRLLGLSGGSSRKIGYHTCYSTDPLVLARPLLL